MPATRPQGYVSDFAGVLSAQGKAQLEALCQELDEKTRAQLAIVTVKSLQGRPIEDFSIDLASKWGIGYKGGPRDERADRGILLLLAIEDREDRIEVGYGLEPNITDGRAGFILREMVPYLRAGDYNGALLLGAASIAQPIAQEAGISLTNLAAVRPGVFPPAGWEDEVLGRWLPVLLWMVFGVFFFGPLFLLILPKRIRRRFGRVATWVESNASGRGGGNHWGGGG
ncbi:MAG: TPM domain-containing protein, partial [Acidobacteria bacterium]|nr:TPM domain-containing protein [Acidobacteriota bacterium]